MIIFQIEWTRPQENSSHMMITSSYVTPRVSCYEYYSSKEAVENKQKELEKAALVLGNYDIKIYIREITVKE